MRAISLRHDFHLELTFKSPVQLPRGLLQCLYALPTQIRQLGQTASRFAGFWPLKLLNELHTFFIGILSFIANYECLS